MSFRVHLIEKLQGLVEVHHQVYKNRVNYWKTFQNSLIFLNPNLDKIYGITTSILEFIVLIVSSQKLTN